MTKLWPVEVFRKFQVPKQFEIQIWSQTDWAGKFPPKPQVDWGVDWGVDTHRGQVDCPVDTGVDLGGPTTLAWVHLLLSWLGFMCL